jgi:hypothetical protein
VDFRLVTGFIHLNYKPQQITITWNSFFNSSGSSLNTGPNGPTLLPGPTKQLGWLGSWTPTWTAFSGLELNLPLNLPFTLDLLLTVLLNSVLLICLNLNFLLDLTILFLLQLFCRGPQRDYQLSLLKLLIHYRSN